jgi:hypothetical protein
LVEVAGEFKGQAAEFQKVQASVEERMGAAANRSNASAMPEFAVSQWPWPQGEATGVVRKLASQGQVTGAILLTDILRTTKEVDDSKYYALRAGVLLGSRKGVVMDEYVHDELIAAKQTALIEHRSTP